MNFPLDSTVTVRRPDGSETAITGCATTEPVRQRDVLVVQEAEGDAPIVVGDLITGKDHRGRHRRGHVARVTHWPDHTQLEVDWM